MATARNERHTVSWDDLLAAVNPPPAPEKMDVWEAVDAVTDALMAGQISKAEAQDLIRELLAADVEYDLRGMIAAAASASDGERPGKTRRRWRFMPAKRGSYAR